MEYGPGRQNDFFKSHDVYHRIWTRTLGFIWSSIILSGSYTLLYLFYLIINIYVNIIQNFSKMILIYGFRSQCRLQFNNLLLYVHTIAWIYSNVNAEDIISKNHKRSAMNGKTETIVVAGVRAEYTEGWGEGRGNEKYERKKDVYKNSIIFDGEYEYTIYVH